jgi:hypothetical protein
MFVVIFKDEGGVLVLHPREYETEGLARRAASAPYFAARSPRVAKVLDDAKRERHEAALAESMAKREVKCLDCRDGDRLPQLQGRRLGRCATVQRRGRAMNPTTFDTIDAEIAATEKELAEARAQYAEELAREKSPQVIAHRAAGRAEHACENAMAERFLALGALNDLLIVDRERTEYLRDQWRPSARALQLVAKAAGISRVEDVEALDTALAPANGHNPRPLSETARKWVQQRVHASAATTRPIRRSCRRRRTPSSASAKPRPAASGIDTSRTTTSSVARSG